MERRYYYNYAEIDPSTNMCIGVETTSREADGSGNWVEIPVYDEEYICKYYICETHSPYITGCTCGRWYEDAEGTIPWQSSLL